ncbi:MAG: FHA domain-containing protein [Conexibacter sp.]
MSASSNWKPDPPQPRLSIWSRQAPAALRTVTLPVSGTFVIGTLGFCDLALGDDPWVSRTHAEVELHAGRARIVDLGSTNGTKVNGRSVRDVWLAHGDVVEVGDTCMQIHYPALGQPTPPRAAAEIAAGEHMKAIRRAVMEVDRRLHGNWIDHRRAALDKLVGDELAIGTRRARKRLDDLFRELRLPSELRGSSRLQAVADVVCGRYARSAWPT